MTTSPATMPMPKNRTLLWTAGLAALYTIVLIASAAACANGLTRADNLVAIAISVACVALIGIAGLQLTDRARSLAHLATGVLGGMYLQPSSAVVLSVVVTVLGFLDAWRSGNRLLGVALIVVGFGLGLLLTYGVLMRVLAPTDIRC